MTVRACACRLLHRNPRDDGAGWSAASQRYRPEQDSVAAFVTAPGTSRVVPDVPPARPGWGARLPPPELPETRGVSAHRSQVAVRPFLCHGAPAHRHGQIRRRHERRAFPGRLNIARHGCRPLFGAGTITGSVLAHLYCAREHGRRFEPRHVSPPERLRHDCPPRFERQTVAGRSAAPCLAAKQPRAASVAGSCFAKQLLAVVAAPCCSAAGGAAVFPRLRLAARSDSGSFAHGCSAAKQGPATMTALVPPPPAPRRIAPGLVPPPPAPRRIAPGLVPPPPGAPSHRAALSLPG